MSFLFPYKDRTAGQWWHRLAIIIFIVTLIATPLIVLNNMSKSNYGSCNVFIYEPVVIGNEVTQMPISTSDPDYKEMWSKFHDCSVEMRNAALLISAFWTVIAFFGMNVLYYRIILYIAFGKSPKKPARS